MHWRIHHAESQIRAIIINFTDGRYQIVQVSLSQSEDWINATTVIASSILTALPLAPKIVCRQLHVPTLLGWRARAACDFIITAF